MHVQCWVYCHCKTDGNILFFINACTCFSFKLQVYVSDILFKFCIHKVHSYLSGLCGNLDVVKQVFLRSLCSVTTVPHMLRFGYKAESGD